MVEIEEYGKKPRIYVESALKNGEDIQLTPAQAHYFKNVLRRQVNDSIRIFNAKDGEWLATLTALGKKSATATLQKHLKEQPPEPLEIHLLFAPIKKARLDILIEKAVELGVTDLHPVTTDFTQNGKIREDRLTVQIIEAAEQCERLDIPRLHKIQPLTQKLKSWDKPTPILWACERGNHSLISQQSQKQWAFLIGPEGGFAEDEVTALSQNKTLTPVSLGTRIYRTETAASLCLAHANLQNME